MLAHQPLPRGPAAICTPSLRLKHFLVLGREWLHEKQDVVNVALLIEAQHIDPEDGAPARFCSLHTQRQIDAPTWHVQPTM